MSRDLEGELERRLGVELYRPDFEWRDEWLTRLTADRLDVARAVLAEPEAVRLDELVLFASGTHFGHANDLVSEPLAPLDELLPHVPSVKTVHASAQTVVLGAHDQLETLSIVTRALPRAVSLPALVRLELCIEEPVLGVELDAVLAGCPALTELVLRGSGFSRTKLGAIAYPRGLALVFDAEVESATELFDAPGTLERLARLSLRTKAPANRLALLALEKAIPLATQRHQLALDARWREVERGCFGPIDPALRVWEWKTREEGRASGWVAFLPHLAPRELELLREPEGVAVYADLLEQRGEVERAHQIRAVGMPFVPRTLHEAMALLACAWKRISSGFWIRANRPVGSIDPLTVEELASYTDMFAVDEHPLSAARMVAPGHFEDELRALIAMMRSDRPATLLENEWLVRADVATFTPPLGRAREALALRDAWNDKLMAAETEHGYALLIWSTGA